MTSYLVEHYEKIGDVKTDFRNWNLFHLVATLIKGESVVDVGCGAAFFLSILKAGGKNVVGVEPNSGMRALASQMNPGVVVIPGRAEEIDVLLQRPVDSVVMIDVLEHIEDDAEQVKKVQAILKKNGEFVFVVPAYQFLYGKRDKHMGHYRRYSKKSLQKILTANGFLIQHMRHWNALGFLPYLISEKIFHKPLQLELRRSTKTNVLTRITRKGLHFWLRLVENNFDFGFGLSIIGVARKI
ncbi:MAG: class I SAM-dependent methyltransferase [Candidatus Vogelbacteria bacterium]|nr:class I SAM-dependent methyltransferase [Candidatus Vogelbacteria bacterium]